MPKSTEEQIYKAFSDAVNSGDLEGAFQYTTDDIYLGQSALTRNSVENSRACRTF